jgi:hypothetical protein
MCKHTRCQLRIELRQGMRSFGGCGVGLHEPGRETLYGLGAPSFDELWDELDSP